MSITQSEGPNTVSTSEDPFATLRKRRRGVRVTTAAVVALGLAITGGSVAAATTPSSGRPVEVRGESGAASRPVVRSGSTTFVSTSTGPEVKV
jgi:hypothetical protein